MLLEYADVYAGAQGYPLFTMSNFEAETRWVPETASGILPARNGLLIRMDGSGGARRDRTDDLKLAKLALSQLSYGPDRVRCRAAQRAAFVSPATEGPTQRDVVGLGRFELPTSRLSSARSNQLSYRPEAQASMRRKRNVGGGVPR